MLFPSFYPLVKKKADKKSPEMAEIRIPTSFSTIPVQDHPQLEWMTSTIPAMSAQMYQTQPLLKVLCVLIYIYMIIISMLSSTSSIGKYTFNQSQIKLLNKYCSCIFFTKSTWKGHLQMKQGLWSYIKMENYPNKFYITTALLIHSYIKICVYRIKL